MGEWKSTLEKLGLMKIAKSIVNKKFWQGKRVLLTGHTGFKGSWLTLWLSELGAQITGIGLDPDAAYILNLPLADQNRLEYLLSKLLELSED